MSFFAKFKTVFQVMLLILAIGLFVAGWQESKTIRDPSEYTDRGVFAFHPYRVLPHSEANTATGRLRHSQATKTVYYVYHRPNGRNQWRYKMKVGSRAEGADVVRARKPVQRRVLSIPAERKYITVSPEMDAKSYISSRMNHVRWLWGIGAAILALLGGIYFLQYRKNKREEEADNAQNPPYMG
ncbi:hypothetical protein [Anaerobiospirillum sp. NML120449]|uniref:hypothetical protein n=1 Tax=Anaerobiospirillum sp. NML120449 TaxID=2932817 RepID=UPI001FF2C25D|nr:hypothetical protein [Anaerobiospirillum sp. NML120449]MCK0525299.1 hypothetical protein [Anaerobiospirillum sp. NML120449]